MLRFYILVATLRDYAKFGELYLNKGEWNGEQVVPASWVDASHDTDGPHLKPGESELSSSPWGYGLQWWVPGFPDTDYTASGVDIQVYLKLRILLALNIRLSMKITHCQNQHRIIRLIWNF